MIRSAPTSGELAVVRNIDSSGSKEIQHCRRKYSDGSSDRWRASQWYLRQWWSNRSSQGTSHPPLDSRKMNLASGNRSHTPPASRYAIVLMTSKGLEMP